MRRALMVCLALSAALGLGLAWGQQSASKPAAAGEQEGPPRPDWSKLPPVTAQTQQYDGQSIFQLFNRPSKNQGLDTLLSRGRVMPEDLLYETGKGAASHERVQQSARTIFHDQYTGAEVWRITDIPYGVVRHTYSGVPAWNANGHYILLSWGYHGDWRFDQGNCTLSSTTHGGEWSPTEPNIVFGGGDWQGHKAIVAYDIVQQKAVRGLGPVRTYAGVAPISPDGKYACWREGTQDDATTFGWAATDGSSFKSIAIDGGIVAEQTPPTFAALADPPPFIKGKSDGIHQMYFTKRPDHSVMTNNNGAAIPHGRIIDPNGKIAETFEQGFTHMAWEPTGKYVLYMKAGAVTMNPDDRKVLPVMDCLHAIEGHTTWNDCDPNWAGMSWRTTFAGEIIRVSMRPDHSIARLCGSCPLNPETGAYNNDEFACISPDGTKVLFMSTMGGNVNEYLVVGANPHSPTLAGQWKDAAYELTITPNAVSHETREYRIYRTDKSGQDYRQVGVVAVPDGPIGTSSLTFDVKDLAKGQEACFAVRAEEWSGLLSRYSNDVSTANKPTASYIEPEYLDFTGYLQGFDPQGASDLYYLFVPKVGENCTVTFENPQKEATVYARVGGKDVAFSVNGNAVGPKTYEDWTWVSLGNVSGSVKIESKSVGFKLDRIFITPDKNQIPQERGLDYRPDAAFAAATPAGAQATAKGSFAAEVTWKGVPNARYYNLYASDKADFEPAQSNLIYSPPAGTEHVIDWGLKPGTTYYYKVVAVDDDGTASKASSAVELKTAPLRVQTVELTCASAPGAKVEEDKQAAGGKGILLDKADPCQLKFIVAAEGDYVIWHDFYGNDGSPVRIDVKLDDVPPYKMSDEYDLTALRGKAMHSDYVWSRFTFLWSKDGNGVLHLKAGEHTIDLSSDKPIHLDKLIITNDQSFVPAGKLCTF